MYFGMIRHKNATSLPIVLTLQLLQTEQLSARIVEFTELFCNAGNDLSELKSEITKQPMRSKELKDTPPPRNGVSFNERKV